ncbi:Mov34/MPN/PAD-1 family protein [Brevibacillus daliensis]|uniref:Mov34/MPN/PAD-1 family protein n=1 Tax=Brevibacillus daliensis TaxID=2892995 RepID=UPI001E328436|nr:M67 family metallopeptidase [Brevibacillus daliensis]
MLPTIMGHPFQKNKPLTMKNTIYKQLVAEAKQQLPLEFSALLAGQDQEITAFYPAPVSEHSVDRFTWKPAQFFSTLQKIRHAGLQWQGIIHTHPVTDAFPSSIDVANWHYPMLSYWIISFSTEPETLVLYKIEAGTWEEYPFVIV